MVVYCRLSQGGDTQCIINAIFDPYEAIHWSRGTGTLSSLLHSSHPAHCSLRFFPQELAAKVMKAAEEQRRELAEERLRSQGPASTSADATDLIGTALRRASRK